LRPSGLIAMPQQLRASLQRACITYQGTCGQPSHLGGGRSVRVEKPLYCVVGHCGCGLPSASVGHHCRALRAYAEPLPISLSQHEGSTGNDTHSTPDPWAPWDVVQVFLLQQADPPGQHSEEGFYVGSAPNCHKQHRVWVTSAG
jgi:hypothetical protein